jgi:hypothetical protein
MGGGECPSPGVKQLGYEAGRSPLSNVAKAKNAWTQTSTPPIYHDRHRDNLTFAKEGRVKYQVLNKIT